MPARSNMQIQEAFYLIIDLEATCCDSGSIPREEMEIIEIGAVMQHSRTYEIASEFQTFVRPRRNPVLTPFCCELTSISQSDVDAAPDFAEAMTALTEWMAAFPDFHFCSWGNYDRNQFQADCDLHGVAYPFGTKHTNLKAAFAAHEGQRRQLGLGGALKRLKLQFEGTHHRGIDDARNIARVVRHVLSGCKDPQ